MTEIARPDNVRVPDGELRLWRYPATPGLPTLHFAHATGFHGRTYGPLFQRLQADFNVIAWDLRGHGDSRALGTATAFRGWASYYRDLETLIDREAPLYLAGHSVGATASLVAAGRRPGAVQGLLLADPVLLAPRDRGLLAAARVVGLAGRFSLARRAACRRAHFASAEVMFRAYQGRGAFRTWPDSWLRAYVQHATVADGDGVRLACDPAFESRSFAATETCPWPRCGPIEAPVTVLVGERDSTCASHSRSALLRRYPHARIETVPGTTHFVPMEAEGLVVDRLRALKRAGQARFARSAAR